MILAGDVGGTKTLLGLFRRSAGTLRSVREATYSSRDARSLVSIIERFLAQGRQKVHACAVGVAGPVVDGRSQVVNLKWPVDAGALARALRLPRAHVLNDLEATAWGIPELPASKVVPLTPGMRPSPGNAALIAAGTGLGTTLLFWDGRRHHPSAGEGGHQGFAPRNEEERELHEYLQRRYDRVSVERVVAGPGFSAIYEFLVDSGREKSTSVMQRRFAETDDPNAVVSAAGLEGVDRAAKRAVDLFVSLYGAAAGDLALVSRATGGVWVGGGIAPKILPRLRDGSFVRAFRDKGRLSPLVERIPVRVILEPRTALLGAAARAARGASRAGLELTRRRARK